MHMRTNCGQGVGKRLHKEGPGTEGPLASEDDGAKKMIKREEGPVAEDGAMKKRIKSEEGPGAAEHNRKSFTLGPQNNKKTKLEDMISAFHKSVRGSNADTALYYLARMLRSGQDPKFIARSMVVTASEDIGLADNSLLPFATAAYTVAQQIGMPDTRVSLAHCTLALSLTPKSTRAYRALNPVCAALEEPGIANLPVPKHLWKAPEHGTYKYPPNYVNGIVKQEYLPNQLLGRHFLENRDLGTKRDL